jgi:DNA-binding transcriptional MerR regulator
MNKFSIKDIENLTGIKAHTLRIWEQRYGILQPKRTPTNIRYYDAEDLKLALRVALLNNFGYKISRIHQMNEAEMASLISKINDQEFRLQVLSNEMLEATLDMDMDRFEMVLNNNIRRYGFEQAVEQLIFLFLEKIGVMWLTDRLIPAQEHLASNILYRKIALAIEHLPPKEPDASPSVLLFLPEGEIHDLGLMYVHYLLRKFGKNPIYLGPNTPLNQAQQVVAVKKPEYVYIHLTSVAEEFDGNRYLQKVSQMFPATKVFVSGSMLRRRHYNSFDNMRLLYNLKEVRDVLISI